EMLERLEDLNRTFEERHGIALAVRIGINTGDVLAPLAAGGGGLIAGDAANVAARLEQAADPGSVLVGDRTDALTRGVFAFAEPVSLSLKGKSEPVIAHAVSGVLPSSDARPTVESALVGRQRELSRLHRLLDDAVETGTPRLVVVVGTAGIGK